MATLSVTVPDAIVPQVMDALRAQHPDLTGDVPGGTPLGTAAAARAVIAHWVRAAVKQHAAQLARQEQQNTVGAAEQQAWQATEGIG